MNDSISKILRAAQNKRVIITTNTDAQYMGILHNSSDNKIILSELCIIHKSGTSTMSGNKEKRRFSTDKIKGVEYA